MSRFLVLCLVALLSGCAGGITLEQPGRHNVGSSYSIETSRAWSHYSGPSEWRTIDGLDLGVLHTLAKVEDGEPLLTKAGKQLPKFKADFSPVEIAEFVSETVEVLVTGADATTLDFRPIDFGDRQGFRIELGYIDDGLPMRLLAAGAVHDGKLDLILFTAPAEYYFDLYAPEVRRIIDSVQTIT